MTPATLKLCRHCGAEKPVTAFYPDRATGRPASWCKACTRARVDAWAKAHPKRRRASQRRYRKRALTRRHPGEAKTCRVCNRTLPRDEGFHPYSGQQCKRCWTGRVIAWKRAHPAKARASGRASARRRRAVPAKRDDMNLQHRLYELRRHRAATRKDSAHAA
ncbi:MAG: hypothetical protein IMZ44_07615 [Planctomycetes bacterium]|nr:hypothetical protein [Planctomycetota bacterium]